MSDHKPCPFCGGEGKPALSDGVKWGCIECDCGARGPDVRTGYGPVEEWAERAWAEWDRRTA